MTKGIVHMEMPAKDGGRARKFYSSLLGWKFKDSGMPQMDYFMTEDVEPVVAVYTMPDQKGPVVYFGVDDIDAAIRKVRELGGTAQGKGAVPEQGWFVYCADTEGNPFALWQQDKAAPMMAPEPAEATRTR
jgi:predicted enzyme related to lactoylglutathione lyase